MAMKKAEKHNVIKEAQKHDKDTGSVEVQINILNKEIKDLAEHLKKHKHDFSSRRSLLRMVSRRRQHLKYLKSSAPKSYERIIKKI
jgi:small subunit ribosomal protein S15